MQMNKKSMELLMNVIIAAALGLAILVFLFYTLTSEAGEFSKNVLTCEAKGGTCVKEGQCDYQKTTFKCPIKEKEEKQVCCINPLGGDVE